jgi:hypothetical protein
MFLEGLVILGPWNAVLTALGFFNAAVKELLSIIQIKTILEQIYTATCH